MAKPNRKGRNEHGERHSRLPHVVQMSAAFRGTSPAARAVLLELIAVENGRNNGALALSVRDAAARCNIGRDTANRALQDLEDAGLIEMVEKGCFRQHHRQATTYRLTWLRDALTGHLPTRRYRQT